MFTQQHMASPPCRTWRLLFAGASLVAAAARINTVELANPAWFIGDTHGDNMVLSAAIDAASDGDELV